MQTQTAATPAKRVRPSRRKVDLIVKAAEALATAPKVKMTGDKNKGVTVAAPKKVDAQDKRAADLAKIKASSAKAQGGGSVLTLPKPSPTKAASDAAAKALKANQAAHLGAKVKGVTGRMSPDDRKAQLLAAAVKASVKAGYKAVTREAVATEAKVSATLLTRYFGDMDGLRTAMVKSAVETGNIKLIAEALTHKHPSVRAAKEKYKAEVIKYLFG